MTVKDALWIDKDHSEDCAQAIRVLQENGVEFRTWDVDRMNPTDMDGDPPLLITSVGVFFYTSTITGTTIGLRWVLR